MTLPHTPHQFHISQNARGSTRGVAESGQGGANGCPAEFAFLSEIASHLPDPQICYSQADFAQGATNTGCGSWCCKDDSCSAGCGVLACADFTLPASTSKGARRPLRDRSECRGQRRGADVLSLGQLRTAFSD